MILTSNEIMCSGTGINIQVRDTNEAGRVLGYVHLDIVENDTTKVLELVVATDQRVDNEEGC